MPNARLRGRIAGMTLSLLFRRSAAAAVLLLLAACAGDPYYLGRTSPGDGGRFEPAPRIGETEIRTGRPYLSVCYNRLLHSAEEVRKLVTENCSDPRLMQNTNDLYACSISAPVRATYSCASLSRTAAEARPNLSRSGAYTGTIDLY